MPVRHAAIIFAGRGQVLLPKATAPGMAAVEVFREVEVPRSLMLPFVQVLYKRSFYDCTAKALEGANKGAVGTEIHGTSHWPQA